MATAAVWETTGSRSRTSPELSIDNSEPEFSNTPAMIVLRKNLSKIGRQFFTFLNSEGCDYLKQYLKWRMMRGVEKIMFEVVSYVK